MSTTSNTLDASMTTNTNSDSNAANNNNNNNNRNNLNIDLSNADNHALMSQFSSFLTSPNALSFFNPMQSPLDTMFSSTFQSFPAGAATSPTLTINDLVHANQSIAHATDNHGHKTAALNNLSNLNLQFMNTPTDNHLFVSQQPLTPSTLIYLPTPMVHSSDQLSQFERQLQSMMNMDALSNMNMHQLASIYDIGAAHTNTNADAAAAAAPIATHTHSELMHENDNSESKLKSDDEGLVCQSRRGRKRKIKQEHEDGDDDEEYDPTPAPKKRRGRKKKQSHGSDTKDDLQLLSEKMQQKTEKMFDSTGFVGIRTADGSAEIPLPAHIEVEYEVFGNVCTDKIEDILLAKGRTRYVRGLSEQEKKARRREQNRNAAARSRARKNAMISKVIQLHQENIGLRSFVAGNISKLNSLREEVKQLREATPSQKQ